MSSGPVGESTGSGVTAASCSSDPSTPNRNKVLDAGANDKTDNKNESMRPTANTPNASTSLNTESFSNPTRKIVSSSTTNTPQQEPSSITKFPIPTMQYLHPKHNSWLFKYDDLQKTAPSRSDGISFEHELVQRAKGVNFIIQVAMMLHLPRMCIYAATVFFHRFYMRCSLKRYHYYDIGGACLFLASKVEESTRRLREVAIACTKIASKNPKMTVNEQSPEYWKWRDRILFDEEVVLEITCFDMNLDSPYLDLEKLAAKMDLTSNQTLMTYAKGFLDDSVKTPLCLMWPSKRIVAAALHWGIELTKAQLPLGASLGSDAPKVCNVMAQLYQFIKQVDPQRAQQYSSALTSSV